MKEQVRRVAGATGMIAPLREARNRIFPELPQSRTRIAALEAENRRLLKEIAPEGQLNSYAEARDLLDNQRIAMILALTLAPDSNCIDVGCHTGAMLAEMLRLAPHGAHLAFEPIPDMYGALRDRFPGVDVRQLALSNTKGEAEFKHVTDLPGYSGLRERSYPHHVSIETITVLTDRLDDVVPPDWVPTLIKIDVEGAEQLVIEGGLATIREHKPTVIFEHGPGASDHYGTGPEDMYRLLHDEAGLRIYDLDGGGPYSLDQFKEEYAKGERWQWVAHR
jgi:FkbM family methyltransferase